MSQTEFLVILVCILLE